MDYDVTLTNFANFGEMSHMPLIIDLDNPWVKNHIAAFKKVFTHQGKLIFLTNDPRVRQTYLKHLKPGVQYCMMKPIDISYLRWILDHP